VPPNARRIAYLGSVAEAADKGLLEEFRRALRSFGYIEGQNLVIDSRRELDPARLAGLGGDLARL
jgi:ABC-type uncharacterized transport system substrate-binding protein